MSEYQDAFDRHVKTRLESSFGKAVAMLILASASNAANAPMMGMERDHYVKLCETICTDQRVVDMWGAAGAHDALDQWKRLVG